jgi:hypothetical protein
MSALKGFNKLAIITAFLPAVILYSQTDSLKQAESKKPQVEFFKEEITLSVDDSLARVEGIYYFRNSSNKQTSMPVLFPFYVDSLSAYPHRIEAYVLENGKKTALTFKENRQMKSITLMVPIKANSTAAWYLEYEQKLKAKKATYIITSTAMWNKPLEEAAYYFKVPERYRNVVTFPEADTIYNREGFRIYKSQKYDFMPEQDMKITWQ